MVTTPAEPAAERIAELEMRLAFMDDQLGRLEEALAAQHQRIEMLEARLAEFVSRLEAASEASSDPAQEPPPPHY